MFLSVSNQSNEINSFNYFHHGILKYNVTAVIRDYICTPSDKLLLKKCIRSPSLKIRDKYRDIFRLTKLKHKINTLSEIVIY